MPETQMKQVLNSLKTKAMRSLFSIILAILIFTGCKKNYTTIVEGTTINFGNKEPIDSVRVRLQDGVANYSQWGASGATSSLEENIVYSDKNGKFRVSIEGRYVPYLSVGKEGYTYEYANEGAKVGIRGFKLGEHHTDVVMEMKSIAYFKPILASKLPTYENDTLVFEKLSVTSREMWDKFELPVNLPNYYYGKGPFRFPLNENYDYQITGDVYKPYRLILKRNGIQRMVLDSVYIKGHTTFTDTLYY